MDVITQCVLGASAGQAMLGRKLPRSAWLAGLLGGFLPDADVFIKPAGDPLGGLLWHRHFTHGVGFIPVGALIAVIPFLFFASGRRAFGPLYLAALAGIATHGVLDACTSYGTVLWWPISERRVSLDLIGIIDPLVTLPLLVTVVWSVWLSWCARHDLRHPAPLRASPTRWRTVALVGFLWAWGYIFLIGGLMHWRASNAQAALAAQRGHAERVERPRVMPQPLTLALWRSVYIVDGEVWSDSIRTVPWRESQAIKGRPLPLLTAAQAAAIEPAMSPQMRRAIEGFFWFTDGYVSADPSDPCFLGDMRYGVDPSAFSTMWGVRVVDSFVPGSPSVFTSGGGRADRSAVLWRQLIGSDPRLAPVEHAR